MSFAHRCYSRFVPGCVPVLTLLLLTAVLVLAGCGRPIVHAQITAPTPVPSPTPVLTPRPAQCFAWGTCTAFEVHSWGYCQWQTEQGPTTFTAMVEIGIRSTPTDPHDKNCNLLFGGNLGAITSISGNMNYISDGVDRASMCARILTPGYGPATEWLAALKFAVHSRGEESNSFYQRFSSPIKTPGLWVDFDDDLDGAKPSTISVAFQGTLLKI